ncbi:MAG: tyrosine-type recombinase/integrase, partial [Anaerolineae bacterium]|nr:tyrosine-type recombinase/integrase [Anaerolineae bacterium]
MVDEYLQLRRALGHKMEHAARLLPQFVAYLEDIGAESVTIEAALAWAQSSAGDPAPASRAQRLAVAGGFARYLVGIDPRTEVPPASLLPYPRRRRLPFIYSPHDIAALMAEARRIQPPLRSATYETLIGLLAATGMRVGEAIRLDRTDVNLAEGVLAVRMSKFGKSLEVLPQDWDDLDVPTISAFLDHLETDRHNSPRTRNARLAAIRSLFRYASLR